MTTEAKAETNTKASILVDIVSDVVCPWCVIGYKNFELALGRLDVAARIRWRAYLLNPDTPKGGRNVREHIAAKYGTPVEKGDEMRQRLTDMGAELGFTFNFTPESRTFNTELAQQLLRWAGTLGKKHALKMAMFDAQFTDNRIMDDPDVLADIAAQIGLDRAEAAAALADGRYAEAVREEVELWARLGVSGVPTFIFNESQMLTGAQPPEVFEQVMRQVVDAEPQATQGEAPPTN